MAGQVGVSWFSLKFIIYSFFLSLAQFKRTSRILTGNTISEFDNYSSVFDCLNNCLNESIKNCHGVETSLIESTNGTRIKCVFKDSTEMSKVVDDFKENFYLDCELLFDWLIWFASNYPSFSL
jgi:hypothetical protein